MRRHKPGERRTRLQSAADEITQALRRKVGRGLRDARRTRSLTQAQAASAAGISRSEWSGLELGTRDATLWLANRAAFAVGGRLNVYLEGASAADAPRDADQLRAQELIIRTALAGGWAGLGEEPIDRDVGRSRFADVLLGRQPTTRHAEYGLFEVIDWFNDVGDLLRAWQRRLDAVERYAIAKMAPGAHLPAVSGCWVVRATRRNRQLVADHRHLFQGRFPGSSRAWLAALTQHDAPMPADSALLWVSVSGQRLHAARLR